MPAYFLLGFDLKCFGFCLFCFHLRQGLTLATNSGSSCLSLLSTKLNSLPHLSLEIPPSLWAVKSSYLRASSAWQQLDPPPGTTIFPYFASLPENNLWGSLEFSTMLTFLVPKCVRQALWGSWQLHHCIKHDFGGNVHHAFQIANLQISFWGSTYLEAAVKSSKFMVWNFSQSENSGDTSYQIAGILWTSEPGSHT